jgi:alpha-beta hydrolase superfamily lysophospholipase
MREAEDVAAAFVYARESWPGQPIVLYGVSMGSAAILRAVAVEGVRPAGLILEGAFDRLLTTSVFAHPHLPTSKSCIAMLQSY